MTLIYNDIRRLHGTSRLQQSLMLSVSSGNLNPRLENQPFCESFRGRHSTKWKIWFQAILSHLTLQLSDDIRTTVEFTCSYQLTYITLTYTFLYDTVWK